MKKKPSRTNERKPRHIPPIALQHVQGRAGAELDLDGVRDPLQIEEEQHNETLVRERSRARRRARRKA